MFALLICLPFQQLTPALATNQVMVGQGSYTTAMPAGAAGPKDSTGAAAHPYVTSNVTAKVPTNDWWTSLVWKVYPTHASEDMYPHPLSLLAKSNGLGISYPTSLFVTSDNVSYHYSYAEDMTAGTVGLNAAPTDVKVDGFSEWTVTAEWASYALKATFGHGLPFVYLNKGSSDALITLNGTPTNVTNNGSSVQLTVNGHTYGIFGPTGSTWTINGTLLQSSLNGKSYYSIAVLPDSSAATFNDFKTYAFSFVTDTKVSWSYNQATSQVVTNYNLTTVPQEGSQTGTLFAIYRHEWLYSPSVNTSYTYNSPRGLMKVVRGNSFNTTMTYNGILPWMPQPKAGFGAATTSTLNTDVNQLYGLNDAGRMNISGTPDTYWTGKGLGRAAQIAPLAEELGNTTARDSFITTLKTKLQDWFSAPDGKTQNLFYYEPNWGSLIGYPASYGSDTDLNDHYFHYGYFVKAAATVALYDPTWASSSNWGGMVEMLIKDADNWDTTADPRFPFARNFDAYAGHSWASGDQPFAAGNNEESSSEALNFASGVIMWGTATGNNTIRDFGIYLYTTEVTAVQQYWFDVDQQVFPHPNFIHNVVGQVWGDGGAYATWWTGNPEDIHGINFLPITAASLYLGLRPNYVASNYQEMLNNIGGPEREWQDIDWSFEALNDPATALNKFNTVAYTPEAGETTAHTLQWMTDLNTFGHVDSTITANTPFYAVFNKNGAHTYVAYNAGSGASVVSFSNGKSFSVNAHTMKVFDDTDGTTTTTPVTTTTTPAVTTTTPVVTTTTPVVTTTASGPYTQGVTVLSSSQAQVWFRPTTSDSWVDIHYTVAGGAQQNVRMTNNNGTWQQTITGLANGNVISYSFTYYDTAGHDTGSYSYTFNGGTTTTTTTPVPTTTTTPVPTTTTPVPTTTTVATGDYTCGVTSLNSSQVQIWFKPTSTSASVIVHYTVTGAVQQNVYMTNNNGTWQQTVSGLVSGNVISYSFTYQKNGLAYDTGLYTYTK
jgi:endoglucanase Acf2